MSVATLVGSFDDVVRSASVLAEGIEGEFIKFVSQQEECRKKWLAAENEAVRLKQDIAKITAENEALEVKLKHARSQVDIEIKKRMKAEAAQDHLERQVALIRELLNDKDTMSRLNDNERQTLMQLSQCHHEDMTSPRKRYNNCDLHLSILKMGCPSLKALRTNNCTPPSQESEDSDDEQEQ
ncbi:rac GTPase-activating protein 1-like [Orbicella faveolata]|uniref:rac GTPase-activating protein 1-like n=1 Tax=Orbicella faveolata TaxID=48498 RepID=UPI0009E57F14|nr:rac GTPase-activating protein 1-like [Orbicella faveolata]